MSLLSFIPNLKTNSVFISNKTQLPYSKPKIKTFSIPFTQQATTLLIIPTAPHKNQLNSFL